MSLFDKHICNFVWSFVEYSEQFRMMYGQKSYEKWQNGFTMH